MRENGSLPPASFFMGTPGPDDAALDFFPNNDSESVCRSFSQLLAGAMSYPNGGQSYGGQSYGQPVPGGGGGGGGEFIFQQNRPAGGADGVTATGMFIVPPVFFPSSQEGYDEGYADGLISGKDEGQEVGLKTGFETGEELGFYKGCVDVWSSAVRADPGFISARIQRTIKQMDELLQNYPMLEPENESVSDLMDALRLKFRAICASLNLKLEYEGYPKAADAGNIEF